MTQAKEDWHFTVSKYPFILNEEVRILLPKNARILHIAQPSMTRQDMLHLWAQVDSNESLHVERKLLLFGTDRPMPAEPGMFICTLLTQGGVLAWHIYDAGEIR